MPQYLINCQEDVERATLEKLKESGLDERDVEKLKFKPVANGAALRETGQKCPGFVIPYFDFDGKPTSFFRVRRFEPPAKGLMAKTDRKEQKYYQPPNTRPAIYLPPYVNWRELLSNREALVITEGELKAACACKMEIPTIGLGGVWSFMSKKLNMPLITELEEFSWNGRLVYIAYDSDVTDKSGVIKAELALAEQLSLRGANVRIVRIPKTKKGGKCGLDDFLVSRNGGKEKFKALLKDAQEYKRELHEFNREVVYVRNPGSVMIRSEARPILPSAMVQHIFANRHYMESSPTEKNPGRKVKKKIAEAWLEWEGRSEVEGIVYAPGKPEITEDNKYNVWRKWGAAPRKGNIKPWKKLLDFLFKDAGHEARKWFEQWLAYPLQNPGTKLYTSAVIWGVVHGTGKSLVGYTLGRIYGENFTEIDDNDLTGSFNDWALKKQFVMGDEITAKGDSRRAVGEKLKSLITRSTIKINEKFQPRYALDDCINYFWTSNHPDAFVLDDRDRRFFIVEVVGDPLPMQFYDEYDAWYKSDKGAAALFHYLLHEVDTSSFNPRAKAPMTEAKQAMIEDTRSDIVQWCHELPTFPNVHALMSSEELMMLAQSHGKTAWTKNGIARAMKNAGYTRPLGNTQQLMVDGTQVRPWLVKKDLENVIKAKGGPTQKVMRDLWLSDRKSNEIKTKKFVAR